MKCYRQALTTIILACVVVTPIVFANGLPSLAFSSPKQICDETTKTKQKTFHGSFTLKNREHDALTLYGTGEVENVTVLKKAKAYGAYAIKNSIFMDLKVDGFVQCGSVIVGNQFKAMGHIEALDLKVTATSQIEGSLHGSGVVCPVIMLTGKDLSLEKSAVGSIIVLKNKKSRRAVITLLDTVISGTITFERNDGTVVLKGASSVTGAVVGGIVTKGE